MKEKSSVSFVIDTSKKRDDGVVIDVKDLRKTFKVYYDKGSSFKEKMIFWKRNRHETRVVLDGISLQIKKGETVGLIGRNGCGKSTLLKLMTGIYWPNGGSLAITGRVSSLIELGAGFHPDMSGRENIYTNASIFGLTKQEIDERLEAIINFSELGSFIDNPVRTYSSGMYMRLAFSVAINVDADILLIDEILAVGDANFQAKCFNKLRELKSTGVTIVIVSHDLGTISRFCTRALWINEGKIAAEGNPSEIVEKYLEYMSQEEMQRLLDEEDRTRIKAMQNQRKQLQEEQKRKKELEEFKKKHGGVDITTSHFGLGNAVITKAFLLNKDGVECKVLKTGEPMSICIDYEIINPENNYVFGMGFNGLGGECIYGTNTQIDRIQIPQNERSGRIVFHTDHLTLQKGEYNLNVSIVDENGTPEDFYRAYMKFQILSTDQSAGIYTMEHSWNKEK